MRTLIRFGRIAWTTAVAVATAVWAGAVFTAGSPLDDADGHLRGAIALLNAAHTSGDRAAVFDAHRVRAVQLCEQARREILLARQAAFLPPETIPGPALPSR